MLFATYDQDKIFKSEADEHPNHCFDFGPIETQYIFQTALSKTLFETPMLFQPSGSSGS